MIQRSRWACALVAVALGLPVMGRAQVAPPPAGAPGAQPRTHTVRPGDTLWEIARLYLNDPFLWPEVYRLNTGVVEDPHWIFPGEQLALPDASVVTSPIVAAGPGARPVEEIMPTISVGPTVFAQGTTRQRQTTIGPAAPTRRVDVRESAPAIREWEYYAAPWVDAVGGPRDYGRILMSSEIAGMPTRLERSHYQLSEKIYITTPSAVMPQTGERYLVYTLGPQLSGLGQVVRPTGIVEVVAPGTGREAATVRIVKQFHEIGPEHRVTLIDPLVMPASAEPMLVSEGITTDIRWMQDDPILPTIQQYVVLGASARDGVQLGDRFTFVREPLRSDGMTIPEEEIAVAQVIRVTDRGTTAIVIAQTHPAIREGTTARLTARLR